MPEATPIPTPAASNAFARLLSELREGYSQQELSEALLELTQAVRQTGKPGSLTFTIRMTPAKSSRAVTISDDIHRVMADAVNGVIQKLKTATEIVPFLGTPPNQIS